MSRKTTSKSSRGTLDGTNLANRRPLLDPNHPDLLFKNVVAKSPTGRWLAFDTLLQAKTILLPEHHERIYLGPTDFAVRCPEPDKIALGRQFETSTAEATFERLRMHAYNPYRAHGYEIEKELTTDLRTGPFTKRAPRRLKYMWSFPLKEKMKQSVAKLPPQAQVIVDIIEIGSVSRPDNLWTEEELRALVTSHAHMLATRQDPWRIFQYYRGKYINLGLMRLTR